ncbi:MAG: Phosphoglycolate phosphatase [Syntrophorhabdus sp. PtaU1.Bin002]|nr:MAG: Phosphoglycolate phosphatase [Syntrophorhabdus sp. PtaU1.Bin002]
MIRGIIFDFDGTLTELTLDFGHLKKEIEKVALKYVAEEKIKPFEGQFVIETVYGLEKMLGEQAESFKVEAFGRLRELELDASKGKGLYPYTKGVLQRLKDLGIKVGILTRSHVDVLTHVFPDIWQYVQAIVTRHDVKQVKPHPDHATKALRLLGLPPEEVILVGDHPTDILGGQVVGMKTAGVLAGRTSRKAFEEAGATYIIEDIRGIPDLL